MMVYIFKGEKTDLIKVGVTYGVTFDDRLRACQTGSPDTLTCVGYRLDWGYVEENMIHKRFKHLHHHGEWFSLDDVFVEFLINMDKVVTQELYQITKKTDTYKKICFNCYKEYTSKNKKSKFCSGDCGFSYQTKGVYP